MPGKIPKAQSDNDEDFLRLILQGEPELRRYVMAIVPDREEARDIVQDTVIALWKKRESYDSSRPFVPWACRFAANEIRMHRRRNARWRWISSEPLIEKLLSRREELTETLSLQQERLRICLGKLPDRPRAAVERYYFHEEAVPDIARNLGTTAEAVYKILQRARQMLFDCIRRNPETKGVPS